MPPPRPGVCSFVQPFWLPAQCRRAPKTSFLAGKLKEAEGENSPRHPCPSCKQKSLSATPPPVTSAHNNTPPSPSFWRGSSLALQGTEEPPKVREDLGVTYGSRGTKRGAGGGPPHRRLCLRKKARQKRRSARACGPRAVQPPGSAAATGWFRIG